MEKAEVEEKEEVGADEGKVVEEEEEYKTKTQGSPSALRRFTKRMPSQWHHGGIRDAAELGRRADHANSEPMHAWARNWRGAWVEPASRRTSPGRTRKIMMIACLFRGT